MSDKTMIQKNAVITHGLNGIVLADQILMAHTYFTRLRGLIGRPALGTLQAIWIRPCQQVHTHFMAYPLDVVFLDRKMQVVQVVRDLKPWKISPWVKGAHSVLEFSVGGADHVEAGHHLYVCS